MGKICSVDYCERKHASKGFCDFHYRRWRRSGDPHFSTVNSHAGTPVERFHQKYTIKDSGCWDWNGSARVSGQSDKPSYGKRKYGRMFVDNKTISAHRYSYQIHKGEIAKGMFVLHKCDNTLCVNPDHLFLGSHEDNMRDMVEKGRSYKRSGEDMHTSKLRNEQAREARALYGTGKYSQSSLGSKYGVSQSVIGRIVRGESYRDA